MRNFAPIRAWVAAAFAAVVITSTLPNSAESHHSFAMYDRTKTVTVTGQLIRFIPGPNHAQLIFELVGPDGNVVVSDDGEAVVWGIETGPSASIAREGITVKSFPLGTILTATLSPLRDGGPFGAIAPGGLIIKCGSTLPDGGCTEQTGEVFLRPRN